MRVFLYLVIFTLLLVGRPVAAESSRPAIVVSVPVLGMLVRALAPDEVDVHVLLGGNSSPHDYAMKFSDRKALAAADRVYWIGPGLEAFLQPALNASPQSVALFAQVPESRAHVWFSPRQMQDVTQRLAADLAQLLPQQKDAIAARAGELQQQIAAAGSDLGVSLQPLRDLRLIAGHDAYAALVEEFKLQPVQPVLQQIQSSATAQRMTALDKLTSQRGRFCVIEERNHPVAAARALAQRHQLPVVELDVYGAFAPTYTAWLQALGDTLQHCVPSRAKTITEGQK